MYIVINFCTSCSRFILKAEAKMLALGLPNKQVPGNRREGERMRVKEFTSGENSSKQLTVNAVNCTCVTIKS